METKVVMEHKQEMDWLRKNDPITYYELTSNPTGADEDNYGCLIPIAILVFIVSVIILIKLL